MGWQAYILFGTLLNAGATITLRVLAREKQTAGASFVITAGAFVTVYGSRLLLLPWLGHVQPDILGTYWWRLAGGGLAFALTNICTYKTLVYFDVAVANIAGTVNIILAAIGSAIFLGEMLSLHQLVGAAILLPAIVYGVLATHVTSRKAARQSIKLGLMFALLAGICFAAAVVNEKSLLGHMSVASYTVFGIGGQFVAAVCSALLLQRKQFRLLLQPRIAAWSLLSGVLLGLGGLGFILTEVKSNNLALAAVISNFRLIIVVILGAWLLKERQYLRQKLLAASLSIVGLTVMFWK